MRFGSHALNGFRSASRGDRASSAPTGRQVDLFNCSRECSHRRAGASCSTATIKGLPPHGSREGHRALVPDHQHPARRQRARERRIAVQSRTSWSCLAHHAAIATSSIARACWPRSGWRQGEELARTSRRRAAQPGDRHRPGHGAEAPCHHAGMSVTERTPVDLIGASRRT